MLACFLAREQARKHRYVAKSLSRQRSKSLYGAAKKTDEPDSADFEALAQLDAPEYAPLPRLRRDWARPAHIYTGNDWVSAPTLGSPRPHLLRE